MSDLKCEQPGVKWLNQKTALRNPVPELEQQVTNWGVCLKACRTIPRISINQALDT